MKYLVLLILLPATSFSEPLKVALYENHDNYIKYSRAYRVNWELFKLAANADGFTVKAKPYLWLRSLNALKEKKLDAVIGGYYSKERNKFAHFSLPTALDSIYLYAYKQKPYSLDQIKSKNSLVGVTTNSIGDSLAKDLNLTNVYRKSSSEQVFELLIKGKLDYAIFSESVAKTHCSIKEKRKLGENCLFSISPPIKTNGFHTLYSKTPKNLIIANRIELSTSKLIYEKKVKPIFLNAGYSEQEYQLWLEARQNWINESL
jgi:hypothetical protein